MEGARLPPAAGPADPGGLLTAAAAAVLLALLAGPARAAEGDRPDTPPDLAELAPAKAAPGWSKQGSSLVLYGSGGDLVQELPLRAPDPEGTASRETLGGVSPDGKLAWTLDRRLTWSAGRTKLLDSRRQLKVYGTSGQELWRDESADLPERGAAVVFSADGKTLLLAGRDDAGWNVQARDWMGSTRVALGPFPRLISMALTPNGRFALARWAVPDASDTHTFVDLTTKARKDVASSDLLLGLARIGDDGVVRSGSKVVLSFDVSSSTAAAAPAVSTGAATAPAGKP